MIIPWHDEARTLYAKGWKIRAIADRLSKNRSTVAFAVDHLDARERHRQRCAQARAKRSPHKDKHVSLATTRFEGIRG